MYKDIDENGCTTYRVIDGKQRLSAIIEYSLNEFSYSKDVENKDLAKKIFSELDPNYKKWFCGHFHINKQIDKIHFVYDDFIKI